MTHILWFSHKKLKGQQAEKFKTTSENTRIEKAIKYEKQQPVTKKTYLMPLSVSIKKIE